MSSQDQIQRAPSSGWSFEAMALVGIACLCVVVYLSLVAMLFIGTSRVRTAPPVPANQITAPKQLNFMPR
jgi:hypothetical protein